MVSIVFFTLKLTLVQQSTSTNNSSDDKKVDTENPDLKEEVETNDGIETVNGVPDQEKTLAPNKTEAGKAASNGGKVDKLLRSKVTDKTQESQIADDKPENEDNHDKDDDDDPLDAALL